MIKSKCGLAFLIKMILRKNPCLYFFKKYIKKCPFCVVSAESEAKSAQCGIMRIFLSLRFYVKSFFGDFRALKSALLTL